MKDLDMGDLTIKDSGDLGFNIYHNGKKACFITKIGEVVLMKWLEQKNVGKQPEWVEKNVARVMERGFE